MSETTPGATFRPENLAILETEKLAILPTTPHGYSHTADLCLAGCLVGLSVVGLAGNVLSVSYFCGRRKQAIHPLLYAIAGGIDILLSISYIPVTVSLFTHRQEGVFRYWCVSWVVLFYFLLRMAMFLVLLLSLCRTIQVKWPFYTIRTGVVVGSVWVYGVVVVAVDILYLSMRWVKGRYSDKFSACELVVPPTGHTYPTAVNLYMIILQLELLLPSLLIFISFVLCLVSLSAHGNKTKDNSTPRGGRSPDYSAVTTTVTLFTALFLVCNLPCFIQQLSYFLMQWDIDGLAGRREVYWYSHLVSVMVMCAVNSAGNPCLYILRMPKYRKWSKEITSSSYLTAKRALSF